MTIDRANLADLDEVASLFNDYRVFYHQPDDLQRSKAFIAKRLERCDSVIFLARDDSGTASGFTQLYPLFSSVSTANIWLLNDLYVSSTARRGGVGSSLLRKARDFAKETGALRIELATAHDNYAAQALYEREGYDVDKEFRRYSLITN